MANKTLTPADQLDDPKSPVNGDAPDMAYDEDCHQRHANRVHWLNARRKAAVSGSAADSVASLEAAFTGDTNWHDSTVVTKNFAGFTGDVLPIFCFVTLLMNTQAGQATTSRLKIVDNAVTSYLDGCACVTPADGYCHEVVFIGKHTMLSALAVVTLQVKNSDNLTSNQPCGGWNLGSL